MPLFWNYLAKCLCFKLDFLKIEFQWKTRFLENWIMWNQTLKKKKNYMEFEFHIKFLTLLDFHQIKFFIETWFSKNRVSKQGHFAR